jgi:hypothetical protein
MTRSVVLLFGAMIVLPPSFAPVALGQVAQDGSEARFHDDLLDRFVGKWEVSAVVYGQKFTLDREAEWVLHHQYLRLHEKSREVIPWLKVPFERLIFIGYNHRSKRYVVQEMTVHGADVPFEPEGFAYASRTGDELTVDIKNGAEVAIRGRWTWDRASGTWRIQASRVIAGKEQEPHLDQRAVAARTTAGEP